MDATQKDIDMFYTWPEIRPTQKAYKNMIYRTTRDNGQNTHNYKDRGIIVCDRWLQGFKFFLEDMGKRPDGDGTRKGEFSLDRINNDAGYWKDNCRWTTRIIQGNNTSHNTWITAFNRTQTPAMWGVDVGIASNTITKRIKSNWSTEMAVSQKSLKGKDSRTPYAKELNHHQIQCLKELARIESIRMIAIS